MSLWSSLAESLGTQLHLTSAYHLQANGLVERLHWDLKASLWARLSNPDWSCQLPWVMLCLCSVVKGDPSCSAADMTLRHSPLLPDELFRRAPPVSPPAGPPNHHHISPSHPASSTSLESCEFVFIRMDSHCLALDPPSESSAASTRRLTSPLMDLHNSSTSTA